MAKPKKQKHWYARWWAILIYVLVGLFLIQFLFIDSDTKFLEDQNYEVIDYGYNDVASELGLQATSDFAYVEMKAFGSREEQVKDGLIFLGNKYPDAPQYSVIIFSESEECRYSIDGDIYQAYLFALSNYWSTDNPILMNKTDIEDKMDYMVWVGFLKTELTKLANGEETEKEYSSYEIGKMLDEYDKLNNTQIDRETIYQIYKYHLNDGYCE